MREQLGRNALTELGDAMVAAKDTAPIHPHPEAPDTPPGNLVAGAAAAVTDKVGDTVSGLAQGGRAVVDDLISRVQGVQKRAKAPQGSSTAKRTAKKVRAAASGDR